MLLDKDQIVESKMLYPSRMSHSTFRDIIGCMHSVKSTASTSSSTESEVKLPLQCIGWHCYRRPRCKCESDGAHTTRITGTKPRPYPLVATEKQRHCMGVLPHGVHRELEAVKQALDGLHRNNRQMTTTNKSLVVALEAPHWSVSRPRNPVVARASLIKVAS